MVTSKSAFGLLVDVCRPPVGLAGRWLIDHNKVTACSFCFPCGPVGCWRLWSEGVMFRDLMTIRPGVPLRSVAANPFGCRSWKTMTPKRIVTWMPTILVTVRTFKTWNIQNDDSYENGASKACKTRTVTRIAHLRPAKRGQLRGSRA